MKKVNQPSLDGSQANRHSGLFAACVRGAHQRRLLLASGAVPFLLVSLNGVAHASLPRQWDIKDARSAASWHNVATTPQKLLPATPPQLTVVPHNDEPLSADPARVPTGHARLLHRKYSTAPTGQERESARVKHAPVVSAKSTVPHQERIAGISKAPEKETKKIEVTAVAPEGNHPSHLEAAKVVLPPTDNRKIITVSALKLPPATEPLPDWMRGMTIPADAPFTNLPPSAPPATATGTRLAQNPNAPPLRQPSGPVVSSDYLPSQIEVSVSTFVVLLTTTDLQTVSIADPNIADVSVVNARAVLVNGKSPGVTSLILIDRMKIRQYQVRVVPAQGTRATDIQAAINLPDVTVQQLRDAIILEGSVSAPEEERRALDIAGVFSTKVINHLVVRNLPMATSAQTAQLQADIVRQVQEAINIPTVNVRTIGDALVLEGTVKTLAQRTMAETAAKAVSKNVIDLIPDPTLSIDELRQALQVPTAGFTTVAGLRNITVRQVGDQIILEGTVPSEDDIKTAKEVAGRTGLQVISFLHVAPGPGAEILFLNSVDAAIAASIGVNTVHASGTAKRLVLTGVVPDTNAAVAAEQVARSYAAQVDPMMMTAHPDLVNVSIAIVEINKTAARNLGVQLGSTLLTSDATVVTPPTVVTNNAGGTTVIPGTSTRTRTVDNNFYNGQFVGGNGFTGLDSFAALNPIRLQLNALYSNGDARLLSNPRTTVLSGRTATFQVGGQIPIPISTVVTGGAATQTIQWKDFGMLLDVIPISSSDGAITMRIRTEVSAIDPTITPVLNVPGFTRRATETEVSVRRGGTVALDGLIQDNMTQAATKVPVLGNIPILGALFNSKQFQHNQTELVIFVTPTMVPNPLPPGTLVPAGVFAAGETTNRATVLSNPGIGSFNPSSFGPGGTSGGGP